MADIVGVTLAVIPLVVSALEHYHDVSTCIQRYRNYGREFEKFSSRIRTQRTIFNTTTRVLLVAFFGADTAQDMLSSKDHQNWQKTDLENYLHDRFGADMPGVCSVLRLIQDSLTELTSMHQSFGDIVNKVQGDESISIIDQGRRIRKKILFACSKTGIETVLGSLRDHTQDYNTLVQQTERIQQQHDVQYPTAFVRAKVEQFELMKPAVNDLYDAMGTLCTKHVQHRAHISLQPTHQDESRFGFVLLFEQLTLVSTPMSPAATTGLCCANPVWLKIESVATSATDMAKSEKMLKLSMSSTHRKRALPCDLPESSLRSHNQPRGADRIKTVTFQLHSQPLDLPTPLMSTVVKPSVTSETEVLKNLCKSHNFCNYMKRLTSQPLSTNGQCIGYLERIQSTRHLLYIDSRTQSIAKPSEQDALIQLSHFLSSQQRNKLSGRKIPLSQRLAVARQVSMAILHYHATKWFAERWSSTKILIANPEQHTTQGVESFAHVSIRSDASADANDEHNRDSAVSLIRNRELFDLGCMLLELGYGKPLQELRQEKNMPSPQDDQEEIVSVSKILCQLSTEIGTRYAELVRKCIHCDFGRGFDFTERDLQASFYQNVVCELEKCERNTAIATSGKSVLRRSQI